MTQDMKLNIVLLLLWLVPLIVTFGIWRDLNRRITPQWLLVDTLNHPTMFFWLVAGFFPPREPCDPGIRTADEGGNTAGY